MKGRTNAKDGSKIRLPGSNGGAAIDHVRSVSQLGKLRGRAGCRMPESQWPGRWRTPGGSRLALVSLSLSLVFRGHPMPNADIVAPRGDGEPDNDRREGNEDDDPADVGHTLNHGLLRVTLQG
jgi:hypothetical protein